MSNVLSIRLTRLEKHNAWSNPYAHLSDDELNARILKLTADIEASVGMPAGVYAETLLAALEHGEPFPNGWSHAEVQDYAHQIRRVADGR